MRSNFNNEINSYIIKDVEAFCEHIYEETKKIVVSRRDALQKLAELLFEKEYLMQEEIDVFMKTNIN